MCLYPLRCCTAFLPVWCELDEDTKDKGKLYKPTSRFEKDGFGGGPAGSTACSTDSTQCQASSSTSSPSVVAPGSSYGGDSRCDKLGSLKKKQAEKKKSNLEIFKEELKMYGLRELKIKLNMFPETCARVCKKYIITSLSTTIS